MAKSTQTLVMHHDKKLEEWRVRGGRERQRDRERGRERERHEAKNAIVKDRR